jgi:hypothetical protein
VQVRACKALLQELHTAFANDKYYVGADRIRDHPVKRAELYGDTDRAEEIEQQRLVYAR